MGSLRRTRPENLDDLTIQVAIVRPGPIQGGAVNPYIERRQAMRVDPTFEVPYDHPSLEPVLRDTLGTIIFQDQVIEVAMAFAGFSPGEAEGLRRAMSRKRSVAAIEAYHQRFVDGAMERFDGRRHAAGRAGLDDDRRLLGLRVPQGPWRGVRPARVPVDMAARPLRPGVPVRAARRAADGLLSARRPRPRGPAPRDRDPAARRQRERGRLHRHPRTARCGSAWGTCSESAPTRSPSSSPPATRTARSTPWTISRPAPGRGVPPWSGSHGRVRAMRSRSRSAARVAPGVPTP